MKHPKLSQWRNHSLVLVPKTGTVFCEKPLNLTTLVLLQPIIYTEMKYFLTEATLEPPTTDNSNGGGRRWRLEMPVPRVQNFNDFRAFLKAFYDEAKQISKKFSHRYFALRAGFSSPNFLHLVINGKRNLTERYIQSFASAMKLEPEEKRYFETMVLHNQAKERGIKDYYGILFTLLQQGMPPIDEKEFVIISRWQNVIITELIALKKLPSSNAGIKSLLEDKVTTTDITLSLKKLSDAGIIEIDENGFKQGHIPCVSPKFLPIYQRLLKSAKDILCKTMDTNIFTEESMITLSESQYELLKQRIREFKNEILSCTPGVGPITPQGCKDGVYHLNIQLASIDKEV